MATALTDLAGSLKLIISLIAQKSLDLATPADALVKTFGEAFTFGTSADQVDQIFHDRRPLVADEIDDLDLSGSLKNAFGDTIAFDYIKALIVHNRSDELTVPTASIIHVGGNIQALPWTALFANVSDEIALPAGAWFVAVYPGTGWDVGAGATDVLRIEEESTLAAEYDIIIVGTND